MLARRYMVHTRKSMLTRNSMTADGSMLAGRPMMTSIWDLSNTNNHTFPFPFLAIFDHMIAHDALTMLHLVVVVVRHCEMVFLEVR